MAPAARTAAGTPATTLRPADVLHSAPDGLAVIDARARFVEANPAAVQLCGLDPEAVVGTPSPFPPPGDPATATTAEPTVSWRPASGPRREFAYVVAPVPGGTWWVVSFRDVTLGRLRERRLAAIATVASSVASKRSLVGTLEALAREVARTDALAAVQLLTVNSASKRLHVMGAAGFVRAPDFFDKLMQARALGARLRMLEALETRRPVVVADRYEAVMRDPAWAPVKDLMRHPRWDWFASVPLLARGEPVGMLNAFFTPGQEVGETELEFLLAMAEQAAMAVDHAAIVERERDLVRREERQKLARDLHDSVVQQVFSMRMQARSLGVLVERGLPPTPERVAQVADDLSSSAEAVLADLRGMVVELRPAASTGDGLVGALRSLVDTTAARAGLEVTLRVEDDDDEIPGLDADLREDVYRVVAEALHNAVKHAEAARIDVEVALAAHGRRRRLVAAITDDGRGVDGADRDSGGTPASGGYGMTVMRERAARWGGTVRVLPVSPRGTRVRLTLTLPLPTSPGTAPPEQEETR